MTMSADFITVAGSAIAWSMTTIVFYIATKHLHRRWRYWWSAPVIAAPTLLILVLLGSGTSYADYIGGTRWLITLLGPATVAFAVPIYERRAMIRRYWRVLLVGIVAGSATSMGTAWAFAKLVGLDEATRLSLIPRSISTPFAMTVSGQIGGAPDLTAFFVVLTGIFGAAIGEALLHRLPARSTLARGALFGLGAHTIGSNRAYQLDREQGAIAGLVMVLTGVFNVLISPLLAALLK